MKRWKDLFRVLITTSFIFSFLTIHCQDKPLDYFLQLGIKNNPLIKDLNGQVHSSRIDSLLILSQNKPRVDFRGYAFYAPVINHFGYSQVLTNIANLTSVISASQPILNKKTVKLNLLKTDIQRQSLANTITLTENNLKKAITDAYIIICATYADLAVNQELISFAKEQEKILKTLTGNGIYKQIDYLSFIIDLQGQELESRELKLNLQKQISDLYILCGIKDTSGFSPIKPQLDKTRVILNGFPMFQRFLIDSLRIANENMLLDRNYKPVISWVSDAGLINNDPIVIYQNFGLSIGLNFNLPVYDGHQLKLNRMKLKSEEEIRAAYVLSFKNEYDQQLQQWHEELNQTRDLITAVTAQIKISEMLVNQEKELVDKGSGSVTDYLIAIKNYMTTRKIMNQYNTRILVIQNEINYWK